MATEGPYEPLTTPARCILASQPSTPIKTSEMRSSGRVDFQQLTNLQKPWLTETNTYHDNPESPQSSLLPSPSKLYSINSDITCLGSSLQANSAPDLQLKSNSKWPDSRVLLRQTLRWHASSQSKGNPWDPWYEIFGEMYAYGHTTVYRVRKWIKLVGKDKLELHLQDNPSLTLIEARQMYFTEWLDTRNAGGKAKNQAKRKREGQGEEVEKPKKHKVDHTDSDVEILGEK
ncbi:hypothetical protein PGTUg99_014623 [Puccinia graminis f. sp. tritici]|uniref:Uncharacterized protein n=1 Tax=Puccinia graminis f. sp. tritici TaxID=56615 RepID=A0A5B0RTK8_PUCGR|nr:hypothetical protein PGTUg99_014623 [Puccinia graminis f. sp. tritici]